VETKADNTVLEPTVTLFTDQRTSGVTRARVFTAPNRSGAYHVLCQIILEVVVEITTFVPAYDRYHDLSQDFVASGIYVHNHLPLRGVTKSIVIRRNGRGTYDLYVSFI